MGASCSKNQNRRQLYGSGWRRNENSIKQFLLDKGVDAETLKELRLNAADHGMMLKIVAELLVLGGADAPLHYIAKKNDIFHHLIEKVMKSSSSSLWIAK